MKRLANNFPWQLFFTGVVMLILSLLFKAYDMAFICCIPIVGSFGLCIQGCILDIKAEREIAAHMAERKAQFETEMEEYEKEDRERYGIN